MGAQLSAFQEQFVQALTNAIGFYAAAEAINVSTAQSVQQDALAIVNAPTQALLGRPLIGNGGNGALGGKGGSLSGLLGAHG